MFLRYVHANYQIKHCFGPEDGDSMYLRNIRTNLKVVYPAIRSFQRFFTLKTEAVYFPESLKSTTRINGAFAQTMKPFNSSETFVQNTKGHNVFTLKMEEEFSSEMLVTINRTSRCNHPYVLPKCFLPIC
jgi:hypothetical protein